MLEKEKLSNYLWIGPIYFISVGVLYLWGYWSNFGINIFEYAALSDIVKVSIIPVGSVFIFILIGFFIGEATVADILPEGISRSTVLSRFLRRILGLLIIVYGVILFIFIFYPVPNKWLILPILLMWLFYFPLKEAGFLKEIKNDSARSLAIIAIIALPLYSFAIGKINAEKILNNKEYQYIEVVEEGKKERLKFIGHANEYVFFISVNNEKLVISKVEKISPIHLRSVKSTRQTIDKSKPNKQMKKDRQ